MVTDGSLFEELFINPMLKNVITSYDKESNTEIVSQYLDKNLYDIIIIDEAHEHNVNMDLILTKMRQHCYYNNSIRLVIISATMNDDEAIYRHYYRCISDDNLYPKRKDLLVPVIQQYERSLRYLSIFTDRRFHISPPGETTQYKITEIYENLSENSNDLDNSKEAQLKGYQIAIKIAKTTTDGQILFFSTGQKEILDAVKYLNINLPNDTIALPFLLK